MSKYLLAVALLFTAQVSFAATDVVFGKRTYSGYARDYSEPEFKVNTQLGNAWLEVVVSYPPIHEWDNSFVIVRGQSSHLKFDQASQTVFWKNTPCALWTNGRLQNTGRCLLRRTLSQVTENDGYNGQTFWYLTVTVTVD